MKQLYTLFFSLVLFMPSQAKAQSLSTIENDSIVNIRHTDLSLVYTKNTTAVWHNYANFYVVEPTKNWFVYLHSAQLLLEVDYKYHTFYAIVEDELTGGYKRFLIGEKNFHADLIEIRKGCVLKKSALKMDSTIFDLSFNTLEKKHILKTNGAIGLQINRKQIIVTDYKLKYDPKLIIMSIEYPGEDSIDSKGNVCYTDNKFDYTLSKSGVYSIKKRNWTIPRLFNTINYTTTELITNPSPTNLKQLNSKVWRKKHHKWALKSASYSSIEKVGSIYICTTKIDESGQISYLILDKYLKPIELKDFYNFDLVESTINGVKVTPIISKPTSTIQLDLEGTILSIPNQN